MHTASSLRAGSKEIRVPGAGVRQNALDRFSDKAVTFRLQAGPSKILHLDRHLPLSLPPIRREGADMH